MTKYKALTLENSRIKYFYIMAQDLGQAYKKAKLTAAKTQAKLITIVKIGE